MKAWAFKVTGRVQGVGFRYFTLDLALGFDLSGEVWNAHDGSVRGFVVGEKADLFLKELVSGPGRVGSVTYSETTVANCYEFVIVTAR